VATSKIFQKLEEKIEREKNGLARITKEESRK